MNRYVTLLLVNFLLLAGCQNQIKTDNKTLSSIELQAALEKRLTELNQIDMPQLSDNIGDNEAAVKLVTSKGDIIIKLFPEQAPLAVENLLTHAKDNYYNGHIFHRVIKNFMIQGGDPLGTGRGGTSIWYGKDTHIDSGNGFKNEPSDLLYNIRGSLAMANAGPNTNGSQFFINQNTQNQTSQLDVRYYPAQIVEAYAKGGNPSLDGSYTVFGQVIEGMDIVDNIAAVETDNQDQPLEPVTIQRIEVIKDYHFN